MLARRSPVAPQHSLQRTRVEDIGGGGPTAARRDDRERDVVQTRRGVCVGGADDRDARPQRIVHVLAAEVEAGGQAVHLHRDTLCPRDVEDPLQVQRVLGASVDEATRGMTETADGRVAQGLLHPLSHLRAAHSLPAVNARLDPVELSQDIVRKVELPVGEDVALDPAQDPERR